MTARRGGRLRRWGFLLILTTTLLLVAPAALDEAARAGLSLTLAYLALAGFAVTLSLGPVNLLLGRPNPVSFDLRRDLGIWTALLALAHTLVGLTVHVEGRMHLYFLAPAHQALPGPVRLDAFGLANYTGLLATLLLAGLALISRDQWLKRLGSARWKRWQRWAYLAAALTVVHGGVYQWIEGRALPLVAVATALVTSAVLFQAAGIWRRRHPRRG